MKVNGLESVNNWEIVFNFFQLRLDSDGVKCSFLQIFHKINNNRIGLWVIFLFYASSSKIYTLISLFLHYPSENK